MGLSDTGLIAVALISQVGMIIGLLIWQNGWFRKERFKIYSKNTKDINKLNLDKLRKEMGLTGKTSKVTEETSKLGMLTDLLPVLKKLEPEQVKALADAYLSGEVEEFDGIPPEIIEIFLKGVKEQGGGESEEFFPEG